jgi:hypothetical protein
MKARAAREPLAALVINLSVAQHLGLKVPQELLFLADEVTQ